MRLVRRIVLNVAYLMLGAAIFVAFVLLQVGVGQLLVTLTTIPLPAVVIIVVLPMLAVGLLPGLREVEVAACRTLLGVDRELITPERPTWEHRWRAAAWVLVHIFVGGGIGLMTVGAPTALAGWVANGGSAMTSDGVQTKPAWVVLAVLVATACLAASVVIGWLVGLLLRRLVPIFLGPTWRDRLQLAEQRLLTETEHRRLARDLHDGIGHALSIISLQASAGRRVLESQPDKAARSLEVIETTSRSAADDLDRMLAVLRDRAAPRAPEPGLDAVESLITAHRELGVELAADVAVAPGLPPLLSTTAYRIVSEGLTNARRHGHGDRTRLELSATADEVTIMISNPYRRRRRSDIGGRGLTGMRERAALFGGTVSAEVEAGADGDNDWVLRVRLPARSSARDGSGA
ncbi:sensor histidine kinase [Microlunatus speluncae]|uniref:sensor histidine kinase n=1 Tax=Microlunatus speluncae TaxID=2594267 RepID=UPI0012667036|nr:histidine kinase [Microlunatus speluncae]